MDDDVKYVAKKVDAISFGILSPTQIKKLAVVKVVTPELYDKEGYPVDGGLMDTRMGVIDPGLVCRTDGRKLKDSPGYFGYIDLARPVVHIMYVNLVLNLLRTTCKECGRILTKNAPNFIEEVAEESDDEDMTQDTAARRKQLKGMIADLRTVSKCPHCGAKQGKIKIEKPTSFLEDDKRISPIEIRTRLEKIPNEDLAAFALDGEKVRPEWMVLTILPIPPVTMRPSITLESGERSEDDLTHKLGDIVRINQRLFENINAGAPEIIIEDLWDLLQYHVTTFFNNDVSQLPPARHRGGQPLKTLTERIKSKEGRIRHNLAGKRTNFSARTVVSPDPKIELNEVGVPESMAMNLTVPETVQEWNVEYLKKFIENGPKNYPGANYVVRPDGKRKKVTDETKEQMIEELQPGYKVERHLLDGDVVLFNRQPSLHRMSMMCHRVKVLPGRTFRINPAVCHPYNADFDGDEMNLHVPQTEEARAEAETLMQVQTQLISPAFGLTIMGCIQDSISGNFMLTREKEFAKSEAIAILTAIGVEDFSKIHKIKGETVTGKQLFSAILPEDFAFIGRSKFSLAENKDENGTEYEADHVIIRDGELKAGVMDKKNLGEGSGLMLRIMHKQYGADYTLDVIGKIFRLGVEMLLRKGFSMPISDIDLPKAAREEIEKVIRDSENEVDMLIDAYRKGELEQIPGRTVEQTVELKILERLNRARNDTGKIVQGNLSPNTDTLTMVNSGARGNNIQLAQMTACVGQQALRGGRIDRGYKKRTLSCFKKEDLNPAARGFVRNNYKKGLRPHEFFFCAMTGRDSLMDTALRTPKSGYLYRRLANALQDVKVEYDNTVRDAVGNIVQFQYGEDSIDVSRSEAGQINVKSIIENIMSE
jgi:DNA-directed RNA polymerase subunit A'